jgi:hypothetical protein
VIDEFESDWETLDRLARHMENVGPKKNKEIDDLFAARKAEGMKIDPMTAIVVQTYGLNEDPYNFYNLPEDFKSLVDKMYFARAPNSDIWVHSSDSPVETWNRILQQR